MDKNRERVQQQGGGGKQATTSLPGKREKGQARDQAGVEDDNSQKQVRCTDPQMASFLVKQRTCTDSTCKEGMHGRHQCLKTCKAKLQIHLPYSIETGAK